VLNISTNINVLTRGKVVDNVVDKLKAKFPPGQVVFRDGRRVLISAYVKAFYRNALVLVKREATLDFCSHNRLDLVEIKEGGDDWDGQIVSISGANPNRPSLDSALNSSVGGFNSKHIFWPSYEIS